MTIRKTVTLIEEINNEYGARRQSPAATRRDRRGIREPARRQGCRRRPKASDRLFARARGFAHQGGAGWHQRRPRAWRPNDPSKTWHGDAPRDQTRSRNHSRPRQSRPAGHDRGSDLWAHRRGVQRWLGDPPADRSALAHKTARPR